MAVTKGPSAGVSVSDPSKTFTGVWDYTFGSKQFLALQATVADIALKNGSAK